MIDFDVWYMPKTPEGKRMIIGNVRGANARAALKTARAIYGPNVTVEAS